MLFKYKLSDVGLRNFCREQVVVDYDSMTFDDLDISFFLSMFYFLYYLCLVDTIKSLLL